MTEDDRDKAVRRLVSSGMSRAICEMVITRRGPRALADDALQQATAILDVLDGKDQESATDMGR